MRDFEKVKTQFDLLEVAGRYTHLKKSGKQFMGLCPLHSETTPSFSINKSKQQFYCHGCKAGGDVFDLIGQINNVDPFTSLEMLADEKGINLDSKSNEGYQRRRELQKKQSALVEAASKNIKGASDYLVGRGFTNETAKKFKLGYGKQHHSIIIPLPDHRGMDIGYCERFIGDPPEGFKGKYRLPSESDNELFKKSEFLFNEFNARKALKTETYLLVFEGQLDVMSADQIGFPAAVASMQSTLTSEQAEKIVKVAEENTVVVLVPDKDNTGQSSIKANHTMIKSLNPRLPVKVMNLPYEMNESGKTKDMNDFVKDGLTRGIAEALIKPVEIALISHMMVQTKDQQLQREYAKDIFQFTNDPFIQEEIIDFLGMAWACDTEMISKLFNTKSEISLLAHCKDVEQMYEEFMHKVLQSNENNLTLGYKQLDRIINSGKGIPTGWVVDFMARSAVGKTAFALNVVHNVITTHNVGATFFSFEQHATDIYPKLSAIHANVMQKQLIHEYENFDGMKYHDQMRRLLTGKFKMFDHHRLNLQEIESILNGLDEQYFTDTPCKLVLIDYLGYIKANGLQNKYEAMSEMTAELKQIAKRTNKVFIVLVQTSREGGDGSESLSFSAARDSGTIEENADILLGAYRPDLKKNFKKDEDPFTVESLLPVLDDYRVEIKKNRNGVDGIEVNLKFDKPKQIIRDWKDGEKEMFIRNKREFMRKFNGTDEEKIAYLKGVS